MNTPELPRTPGPPPPVYLLAAVLGAWGLHTWLPLAHWLSWPWRWIGLAFIIKGVFLAAAARMLYFKYHTSVRPFTRSDALVTDVPFAWTRNPMYTGMLLVLSGEALLFGSLGPWLMVPVMWWILHRLFVLKEEEGMRIQFGQTYEDYCARVKRWV